MLSNTGKAPVQFNYIIQQLSTMAVFLSLILGINNNVVMSVVISLIQYGTRCYQSQCLICLSLFNVQNLHSFFFAICYANYFMLRAPIVILL